MLTDTEQLQTKKQTGKKNEEKYLSEMQPDDGGVPCSSHADYRLWRQWGYSICF
ncbi:MAG: hypothetical protein ACLTX3_01245 [Lachnospiraceae bacterium]